MSFQVKILRGGGVTLPDGLTYYKIGQTVTLSDQQFALIAPGAFAQGYLANLGHVDGNSSSGGGVVTVTPSTTADATTTSKGVAKILGGTADNPSVPWSSITNPPNIPALFSSLGGTVPLAALSLLPTAAKTGSYTDLINKPTIPATHADLVGSVPLAALTLLPNVARSGLYSDLTGKPTIPATHADLTGQVPVSALQQLAVVARSGSYTDLANRPTVPATYADLTGTVPQSALPAVALTDFLGAVGSQTAMLALTGQRGDWCTRTDRNSDWQLIADDPTQLTSWREHVYPGSPVQSVNGRVGSVTGLAEATDVTTAIAGRQPLNANLTTIAGLDPTAAGVLSTDGTAWLRKTYAQIKTSLVLVASDVGLGAVNNTADTAKPVSVLQQSALDAKANDSAVVHATGNESVAGVKAFASSPTAPDATSNNQLATLNNVNTAVAAGGGGGGSATDATTSVKGVAVLLGGTATAPTVPWGSLTGKPSFATVATSGAYADLTGKPTIPAAPGDIGAQVADSDLTTIAGLDASTAGMLATDGAGWIRKSYASVRTALGISLANPTDSPAKHNVAEWNYDPVGSVCTSSSASAFVSGTLTLAKITPNNSGTINNILAQVITAGATLTSGQNLAAIYNASGTLLGTTSDQSTAWTTTGMKTMTLSSGVAVVAGQDYFIAILSVGTTPPKFSQAGTTAITPNVGLGSNVLRFAVNGTSLTAMPANVSLASNSGSGAITYWVGLS